MQNKIIGLIGGMGPFAGVDVHKKIYQNTLATSDKEHLDVIHLSLGHGIPDRTQFLLGKTPINPATALANKISNFSFCVVGIACNTFHAPKIFNVIQSKLSSSASEVLHFPNEIKKFIETKFPFARIGVLCTIGTYQTGIYQNVFKNTSIKLKFPTKEGCKAIHKAIYDTTFGIKSRGILTKEAKTIIEQEIRAFSNVEGILLACTELPLIVNKLNSPVPFIDCNQVLARALIRVAAPHQLKKEAVNSMSNV